MNEKIAKKRNRMQTLGMFDLAKGIALCDVIVGHTIFNLQTSGMFTQEQVNHLSFLSVLGQGFMAMFFLASGYGFRAVSQKKCVKTQAKLFLKPYLYTAVACSVCKVLTSLLFGRSLVERGWGIVIAYLFGLPASWTIGPIQTEGVGAVWFLLALFWAWIILNWIFRRKNQTAEIVLTLMCIVAGFLMLLPGIVWPYCIQQGLLAVGYLYAGYQIKKNNLLEKKLHPFVYIVIIIFSLGSIIFGDVAMAAGTWKLGLYDYAASICMGFLFLRCFVVLNYRLRDSKNIILSGLRSMGYHTLPLLCLHEFERKVLPWKTVTQRFAPMNIPAFFVVSLLLRIIILFVLYRLWKFVMKKWKEHKRGGTNVVILED